MSHLWDGFHISSEVASSPSALASGFLLSQGPVQLDVMVLLPGAVCQLLQKEVTNSPSKGRTLFPKFSSQVMRRAVLVLNTGGCQGFAAQSQVSVFEKLHL